MHFDLHIGIDYSGAGTSSTRSEHLQVYQVSGGKNPTRVFTPAAGRSNIKHWNRQEIARWIIERADSKQKFIAGIDHAFSFPKSYFDKNGLRSWNRFLTEFCKHWTTDERGVSVDDIRKRKKSIALIMGNGHELRLTERWTSSAKSVFRFDFQGQVAKSTHAGIPWLKRIRDEVGDKVHFWPFDGWKVPRRKSVIAEVYPSIFRNRYDEKGRTIDEQDAYSTAHWLAEAEIAGRLKNYFNPPLTDDERKLGDVEGWILGIT